MTTSNVHYLPLRPAVRCLDEAPSVRSYSEAFMRTLRTHPDADRIPVHLYVALVDVLDGIVTRTEANS